MTAARRRLRAELALAGNTVIWGSTFVMVKQALDGASPLLFLALRFTLATLALLVLLLGRAPSRYPLRQSLGRGAIVGSFLFLGYALQTIGLRFTTPSKSAFLTGLATVLVPLLAAAVYRTRPRIFELIGVAVATCGMALMTLHSDAWNMGIGDLLTIGCAVAFAGHILTLGHYSAKINFELLSLGQIGMAALLSWSVFFWAEKPRFEPTMAVGTAIVVTGLLATALAFTVQAWAQKYTTATRTALIFAMEPVFAWLTSYALTGEILSRRAQIGAALILAGILLVELKPAHSQQHPLI